MTATTAADKKAAEETQFAKQRAEAEAAAAAATARAEAAQIAAANKKLEEAAIAEAQELYQNEQNKVGTKGLGRANVADISMR